MEAKIVELTERVAALEAELAKAKKDSGNSLQVWGDADALEQLLVNFVLTLVLSHAVNHQ